MTAAYPRIAIERNSTETALPWRGFASTDSPCVRPYLTTLLAVLSDAIAVMVALHLGGWTLGLAHYDTQPMAVFKAGGLLVLLLAVFAAIRLYPPVGYTVKEEWYRLAWSATGVFAALILASTLAQFNGAIEGFLVAWAATILLAWSGRMTMRWLFAQKGWWGAPVVVAGGVRDCRSTICALRDQPWLGLKPVAILNPTHRGPRALEGISVVGATFPARAGDPALARSFSMLTVIKGDNGQRFLDHELPSKLWFKRMADVLLATLMGLVALPVMGLIVLLIKLDSPGPAIYSHVRIGHCGRTFRSWKFRSMILNADQVLQDYLSKDPAMREEWERTHKLKNDPRVTRVGRILRKLSLDELPQLWNVLMGEMSLVGPRPIVNAEVDRYGHRFDLFLSVKPGLTGLWQVLGRTNTTYDRRVSLDLFYARKWSLWMDLKILFRTIPAVMSGAGAY